ncbi:HGH1-like protein [Nymphaea thermarum]|nr:HGH1-like protein [Nymphaea thermarum]
MATELEELLGFLSSPSPQLRRAAVDIVRGLTGTDDGLQTFAQNSDKAVAALSRLLVENKEVAEPAAEALVNMSQNSVLSEKMVVAGMVGKAMEMLSRKDPSLSRLSVMLLANLTRLDAGISSLLQIGDAKIEGLNLLKLVRSFCQSHNDTKDDPFEHVSSILVNVSRTEAGRNLLLDPKRSLLKQIIPQFDSTSLLRKKGVLGTIRNCCFDAENQLQNLLLISEFLWPALLLPVAGKKPSYFIILVEMQQLYNEADTSKMPPELASALSHEREPIDDPEIRLEAAEAIYMIAVQEAGLRALWSVNGPRILQVGYEDEEDPKVMEAYERLGALLVHGNTDSELDTQAST